MQGTGSISAFTPSVVYEGVGDDLRLRNHTDLILYYGSKWLGYAVVYPTPREAATRRM